MENLLHTAIKSNKVPNTYYTKDVKYSRKNKNNTDIFSRLPDRTGKYGKKHIKNIKKNRYLFVLE